MSVLNQKQISKISDLSLDLGKASLIAGFTLPILTNGDILILLKLVSVGIVLVVVALVLTKE